MTQATRGVFSEITDVELARRANEIAEKSTTTNPGLFIMQACQELIRDRTRTPDELAKTLRAFGGICKDKALQRCMVAAADGFEKKEKKD